MMHVLLPEKSVPESSARVWMSPFNALCSRKQTFHEPFVAAELVTRLTELFAFADCGQAYAPGPHHHHDPAKAYAPGPHYHHHHAKAYAPGPYHHYAHAYAPGPHYHHHHHHNHHHKKNATAPAPGMEYPP